MVPLFECSSRLADELIPRRALRLRACDSAARHHFRYDHALINADEGVRKGGKGSAVDETGGLLLALGGHAQPGDAAACWDAWYLDEDEEDDEPEPEDDEEADEYGTQTGGEGTGGSRRNAGGDDAGVGDNSENGDADTRGGAAAELGVVPRWRELLAARLGGVEVRSGTAVPRRRVPR